jgi:hypothetical protein
VHLSAAQRRVLSAIELCRTAALGGHVDACRACGYEHPSYNSCRNRHCPKCQALVQEKWIAARDVDAHTKPQKSERVAGRCDDLADAVGGAAVRRSRTTRSDELVRLSRRRSRVSRAGAYPGVALRP